LEEGEHLVEVLGEDAWVHPVGRVASACLAVEGREELDLA